jgi:hypothetical protein
LKTTKAAAIVVCASCSAAADSADDLRESLLDALGCDELKTSTWAS